MIYHKIATKVQKIFRLPNMIINLETKKYVTLQQFNIFCTYK